MRTIRCLSVVLLTSCLVGPAFAAEKPNKEKNKAAAAGRGFTAQLMKMLEPASLSDEQTTKIKSLAVKAQSEAEQLKKEAGIGPEILKKQTEARKEATEAGKKGKDLQAAVAAAMNLSPDQEAAMKKSNELLNKCRKEVLSLLSDDQKAALPEQARKALEGPAVKGAAKKKAAA